MNEQAPKKKYTWVWILVGVFVFFIVLFVGGVVGAVMFFRQSFDVTENVSASSASTEFDAVYRQFPNQQPLIQIVDGRPQVIDDGGKSSGKPISTIRVLAFEDDEEHLARFSLPFWLVRMKSGPIRLSAYQQGWDDRGVSFRIEDIERHGPGIIADVKRSEGRMLIWAE